MTKPYEAGGGPRWNAESAQGVGLVFFWSGLPAFSAVDVVRDMIGTPQGGPGWIATPDFGMVPDLDGVDDYLSWPFVLDPAAGLLTIDAWVRPTDFSHLDADNDTAVIWQQEDGSGTGRAWLGVRRNASGDLRLFCFLGGVNTLANTNWNGFVGEWHHVAVRYADDLSGAQNKSGFELFVDGVSDVQNYEYSPETCQGNYRLGSHKSPTSANEEWRGQVALVRIWNRALSPMEIWNLYAPQGRWELYGRPRPRIGAVVPAELMTVGRSVRADWDIAAAVSESLRLDWDLRSAVGKAARLDWDLLAATGRAIQLQWNVQTIEGPQWMVDGRDVTWDLGRRKSVWELGDDLRGVALDLGSR